MSKRITQIIHVIDDYRYIFIFITSLATRLYRLDLHPVWFDEIYSYQVSQQTLPILIRNSFFDPSPPLYFVLLKLASVSISSEWAVRWLSALCGAITILVLFALTRRVTSISTSILLWLLLIVSPELMYFSQEARPYIVELAITSFSTLLVYNLTSEEAPQKRTIQLWLLWILCNVTGFYIAYSYLMIFAVQCFYLGFVYRFKLKVFVAAMGSALVMLPLLPLITTTLKTDLSRTAQSEHLTLLVVLQSLVAGDPNRYGVPWSTYLLLFLFGIYLIGGIRHVIIHRLPFQFYLILQLFLPLFLFFAVGVPFMQIHMPLFQARQFLNLLAPMFLLLAYGMAHYLRTFSFAVGRLLFVATLLITVAASLNRLNTYWTTPKSPEGNTVLFLNDRITDLEALVSLHFSLDAAGDFYLKNKQHVFAKPQNTEIGYMFSNSLLGLRGQQKAASDIPVHIVREYPTYWIMYDTRKEVTVLNELLHNCSIVFEQSFAPFKIMKVTNCLVERTQ